MQLVFIILVSILCLPAYCYECYIPGKCNGDYYKIITAESAEACIGNCSINYKCHRSTFDPVWQHCILYNTNDCTVDFEDCPSEKCVTNDKKCIYGK